MAGFAEQLKEVVDLMPDVLFRCYRADDGHIYWSLNEGGLAREFHLTTEEIQGKRLQELFAGGASEAVVEHFEAAFRGETEPFVNEIEGRYFKHVPQPVYGPDGTVTAVVGFISEVTELVLAQKELEAVNESLNAFAHSASHDLRLPLTVLGNLTKLAEMTGRITPDWIGRMTDTISGMEGTIDALLTFSRSGTVALQPQQLDLSTMAHEVIALLEGQGLERQVDWDVEPGLMVRGDPLMMRIVLVNLLGNAWKYTAHSDHPKIRMAMQDGEIRIEDNGSGLKPGEEEIIFEPFQQGHNAQPGHGVGLATVRRIIERHGGSIHAEGGKGASFCIQLPAV